MMINHARSGAYPVGIGHLPSGPYLIGQDSVLQDSEGSIIFGRI